MKQHTLFYGSSYDRGLDILLALWPRIRKEVPDAQLHIAYGWELFERGYANNPERMNWKDRISGLMTQPGITHHGRLGKEALAKLRARCGIWAYPTYFTEINCITALEAQRDGLVPVTMNFGALKETVEAGIKLEGDIYDPETQDAYVAALVQAMTDTAWWQEESKKAAWFAAQFSWDLVAHQWLDHIRA
jgi:glycosyltransferase involved in cell wall biosynthesis